ncbi:MAG: ABC transporter [Alphaproteobacteria bacterium 13_1_20CM_3_64_12]|nr:MAG: ABC transporter [Alphaproteobacteria bacterium 13_1_20CM_3_64_12]
MHYAGRRLGGHISVFASVLAAVCCAIGAQYGVKNLVDVLGAGATTDRELWSAVVLLLALVAGDNLFWRLAGRVAAPSFVGVAGDVRDDLFQHLSGHGTRYFSNRFPGALAGRIATAGNAAFAIENRLAWNTIPPAAAVLSSIAVLGLVNWRLTVALAAIAAVLGSIIAWLAGRSSHLHDRYADRAAAVTGDLADVISNMGLVRAFAAAHRERERLSHSIGQEMSAQCDSLRSLERIRLLHAVCVFLVTAAVVAWSVLLWRAGQITTGDVVLATTLGFTVLHASRDLAMAMVDLLIDAAKLREAVRSLGVPYEMANDPEARQLIPLGGSLSFLGVCFSYPDGERVLQDFTLHIPAGQKVGLVGRSGAGKSTVLALLQRLYDPERGQVVIDEQDIAAVTQGSLRRAIAVVHQDISLLHRSILENLRYGRPDATDAEVYAAAEAAHCTEFIRRLPEGFETIVGERGLKLSGGQRQRLAIARAFLCNAPIILLDEATSALDAAGEQLIQDALARLFSGRTVIAATHRLSTLASFDRIIVLEHKHVAEDVSVAQLLQSYGNLRWVHSRYATAGGRP